MLWFDNVIFAVSTGTSYQEGSRSSQFSKYTGFVSTGVSKQQQRSHTRRSCRRTWWAPRFSRVLAPSAGGWTHDILSCQWLPMCVRAGSHSHTLVQLWSIERGSLRRVAGGHLHGRDQLASTGGAGAQRCRHVVFWPGWWNRMLKMFCSGLCVRRSICSSCGTPSSSWLSSSAPASSFRPGGSTRAPSWTMT